MAKVGRTGSPEPDRSGKTGLFIHTYTDQHPEHSHPDQAAIYDRPACVSESIVPCLKPGFFFFFAIVLPFFFSPPFLSCFSASTIEGKES